MADRLTEAIGVLVRVLLSRAAEDVELRSGLRALAEQILDATGESPGEAAGKPARRDSLPELTLGKAKPVSTESPSITIAVSSAETSDDELGRIEARCRLKAEGARNLAERLDGFGAGLDLDEVESSTEPDAERHERVAGCYEAVAESLALVRDLMTGGGGRGEGFERALHLVVEAQSALRRALQQAQRPDDPDQRAVFEWARDLAARHQIYVRRHMRVDDLADPANWPDLLTRVRALAELEENARRRTRPSRPRADRLTDPLARIREGCPAPDDWRSVVEAVDEMVRDGVPPSNRDLRERLLPVIDDLPDLGDLPAGFRHVLREIDHYLAVRPDPTGSPSAAHEPAPEVKATARLLGGATAVLIGGQRRREAQEALKKAFGLKDLVWVETKEHQAVSTFEPIVSRPDVAVVLLAIRWSSHAFGEVKSLCERHGKPLVRLPGGYNPNQVASQVVAQCSGQLGG
jgi:hypothetical protein